MLKFDKIDCGCFRGDSGLELFRQNPTALFHIKAPLYWWADTDWIKYYFNMPLSDFEFCFDDFYYEKEYQKKYNSVMRWWSDEPRKLMQRLPLSTYMTGTIELTYQEIVEICEDYIAGEYKYVKGYSFPNEREWSDFCETLLDIKGVRDIVKEEI